LKRLTNFLQDWLTCVEPLGRIFAKLVLLIGNLLELQRREEARGARQTWKKKDKFQIIS
jgi:hypothetical protein